MSTAPYADYGYSSASETCAHRYLLAPVLRALAGPGVRRVLDVGCGNGSFTARIAAAGYEASGCDLSPSGIAQGRCAFPALDLREASVYDDLRATFGADFDAVLSIEVIEHLYDPAAFVRRAYDALRPGGRLVITTPYHGYWKNLALAVAGGFDRHFTALWDGGHIKFWSRKTLGTLLDRCGFRVVGFAGAGRLPYFWKSMILVAEKGTMAP
jgi:2-polyprenyl-6-hydroxyphenyl methylase/3-demethylubiquinone-9 3-methyltransferase